MDNRNSSCANCISRGMQVVDDFPADYCVLHKHIIYGNPAESRCDDFTLNPTQCSLTDYSLEKAPSGTELLEVISLIGSTVYYLADNNQIVPGKLVRVCFSDDSSPTLVIRNSASEVERALGMIGESVFLSKAAAVASGYKL